MSKSSDRIVERHGAPRCVRVDLGDEPAHTGASRRLSVRKRSLSGNWSDECQLASGWTGYGDCVAALDRRGRLGFGISPYVTRQKLMLDATRGYTDGSGPEWSHLG